ncbi:MAG: hypothetical protein M1826_003889 [Phylliscum demangeonii]|nr:MAG: hypothetical protein M1826_003889 [Phylliscum demangeonii]
MRLLQLLCALMGVATVSAASIGLSSAELEPKSNGRHLQRRSPAGELPPNPPERPTPATGIGKLNLPPRTPLELESHEERDSLCMWCIYHSERPTTYNTRWVQVDECESILMQHYKHSGFDCWGALYGWTTQAAQRSAERESQRQYQRQQNQQKATNGPEGLNAFHFDPSLHQKHLAHRLTRAFRAGGRALDHMFAGGEKAHGGQRIPEWELLQKESAAL